MQTDSRMGVVEMRRSITRQDLAHAKRIVIKMGTSVVSTNGEPALGRIASMVEQICTLKRQGKEVLLVTSGSVGIGRQRLNKQILLSASLRTHVQGNQKMLELEKKKGAMAAAGQIGLMSLYETLFSLYDVACSQILVTGSDFKTAKHRANTRDTLLNLLELDVIPIVNENDAVSAGTDGTVFSDNDSLASLVAGEIGADLLLLLTDVEGLYNKPPTQPGAKIIPVFHLESANFEIGAVSSVGRGGMGSKIEAAQAAISRGVKAVVIASGFKYGIVTAVMNGGKLGTLFVSNPSGSETDGGAPSAEEMAVAARNACRQLQKLSSEDRTRILHRIANDLVEQSAKILQANQLDLQEAEMNTIDEGLLARLKLTKGKLETLADGIRSIADADEPIGRMLRRTELASGLVLHQETTPIGVLLVIFESRPDSLPQIAALALRSGNGLLLKGGKEAFHSNAFLHQLIVTAVDEETKGAVSKSVIGLVTSREEISDLLALDDVIDLCIPRGSGSMVSHIKSNTRIPVLGHAEGVCHMYIHGEADLEKAKTLAIDAKTDYPAACNALETLLIDKAFLNNAKDLLNALEDAGVTLHLGPHAVELGLATARSLETNAFSTEYGTKDLTVEVVSSLDAAIEHINEHSSGHTECIVTENQTIGEQFQQQIDSACVFHNASTRFADGYRFGLGAEVGISTGRIHARGPVGVEGLLTTKWKLSSESGHTVAQFANTQASPLTYTHKQLELIQQNAGVARPHSSRL